MRLNWLHPFCFVWILRASFGFNFQRSTLPRIRKRVHYLKEASRPLYASRDPSEYTESEYVHESSFATYLSTCTPGLGHVLERELQDLRNTLKDPNGITDIASSGNAAVTFKATREASLHALCWLRSAHRLLELIATTDDYTEENKSTTTRRNRGKNEMIDRDALLYTREDLHNFVRECVDAKQLLGDGKGGLLTISVKAILNSPRQLPKDLSHSHYTALGIKNSLCDVVRDMRGDRPNVDVENPDVPLVAILRGMGDPMFDEGAASLSIYRSLHPPGSLHKRGYRSGGPIHKAAMKESMAAGLLLEAGWKEKVEATISSFESTEMDDWLEDSSRAKELKLIDPMAGSGSFVLEACMMATDIAPGLMRIRCGVPYQSSPPVIRWKSNADRVQADTLWKSVLLDATQRAKAGIRRMRENPSMIQIQANDIHPRAVDIMDSSLQSAGLSSFVRLSNQDCYDLDEENAMASDANSEDKGASKDVFVATNPPWGVRLTEDIAESWEGLRHFIRDKCPDGTEVYVLSGDKTATGTLKLKRDRMIPLQTGDQHLRWIQYTIGKKKKGRGNQRHQGNQYDSKHPSTIRNTEPTKEDSWI